MPLLMGEHYDEVYIFSLDLFENFEILREAEQGDFGLVQPDGLPPGKPHIRL